MDDLDLNKKIGTLPFENIVEIKISGFYYARVIQLVTDYVETHNLELLPTIEELKTREPKNKIEYDFITLISLCQEIEQAAYNQNKIKEHSLKEVIEKSQETDL
jgi:hypothetical protein